MVTIRSLEYATTYSELDNVARLRRSLKGRVKEALENLLIYHARAENIMKMLESRFGRPKAITIVELERLRTLPRLTMRHLQVRPLSS